MKKADFSFIIVLLIAIGLFIPFPFLKGLQNGFIYNSHYWLITSFLKFGLLSTLGESLGLRIGEGVYNKPGFGLLPRAIVWGFLGIGIKMAFVIFASGTPILLEHYLGLQTAVKSMQQPDITDAIQAGLGGSRIITAFAISTFMNLIFAPVFMTLHKITDVHIINNGGKLRGFLSPIPFGKIFPSLNWFVQWDFVFKRTIPFFWIPAHTITFLLPPQYRLVFAAMLGVVLGMLLAIAAQKSRKV